MLTILNRSSEVLKSMFQAKHELAAIADIIKNIKLKPQQMMQNRIRKEQNRVEDKFQIGFGS